MRVAENRRGVRLALATILSREPCVAFKDIPAMVFARANQSDLFHAVLANISQPQITCDAVEAHSPRFAKSVSPNLGFRARAIDKRIVLRNTIGAAVSRVVDIQAKNLAPECA